MRISSGQAIINAYNFLIGCFTSITWTYAGPIWSGSFSSTFVLVDLNCLV